MPTAFGEIDIIDRLLGGTREEREKKREDMLAQIAAADEANKALAAPGGYEAGTNYSDQETNVNIPVPGFNGDGTPNGPAMSTASQPVKVAAADKEIVSDTEFDIKKIADKYGDPMGTGGYVGPDTGAVFTEKEISEKDSKGLIKRGFVENDKGKRVYIYAREAEKEKEGTGTSDAASNPREAAYNAIIKQVEKHHGIEDLRKFNPVTETNKAMDKLKDQQWNWTFGANKRPEDLTPEQQRHWEGIIKELYARTYNEIAMKAQLARDDVKQFMGMYEKSKDNWKIIPENAGGIYNSETAETRRMGPGKNLTDATAKHVEDKVASIFKPIIEEPGMEVKSEDVYNRLDGQHRAIFDEIRDRAFKELRDNPGRTTYAEAISKITKEMGISLEKDKDGKVIMKMGGKQGKTETPPVQGARKGPDGLWYVEKDGKYYRVKQKGL